MSETVASGTTDTVPSGTTKKVRGVLTVEGNLVVEGRTQVVDTLTASATDADSATGTATRQRELATTSVDVDSATGTATRTRTLTTKRSLIVDSGDTVTVASGDTQTKDDVRVSGRLVVEGELTVTDGLQDADGSTTPLTRTRLLDTQSTDADSSQVAIREVRQLLGEAVDTDDSSNDLQRLRKLLSDAADSDASSATTTRVRELVAKASDTDSIIAVLLPRSRLTDSREAAIDLLRQTYNWPEDKPEIYRAEEVPWKSRENAVEPHIYVHKPTGDGIERFSADGTDMREDETVRVDVWVLDADNPAEAVREYRNQIVNRIFKYSNDNYANTEFHSVEPTESTDFRQEHIARQTDHHIYTVVVETERLETVL